MIKTYFGLCALSVIHIHLAILYDLIAFYHYIIKYGIYINVQKTKYMLFGSKVALAQHRNGEIRLKVGKETISRAYNYCYLGVTLDGQLNYEAHAQITFKKVKNKLAQLRAMTCFF